MSERITIQQVPEEELVITPGAACQGCGAALACRLVFKALGPNTIRHRVPGCPENETRLPLTGAEFAGGGDALTGTSRALKMLGREDVNVVGFFGDGGTYDIGLQAISGAAERNENVFVVCKDNEAYMNTGNQRSGSTPLYATTMTTPIGPLGRGKETPKKNILMIFAAHHVPYAASASIAFYTDLIAKVNYAKKIKGFKMLIIHSPCPTGWEYDPSKTIEVARLAVQTGIWPLYEIFNGEKLKMNYKPKELRPVSEYIKTQGRFRHFTDAMAAEIQGRATSNWEKLLKLDAGGELTIPFTP